MPDKEKVKSILKMADITLEMVKGIDIAKYSSNITKEYYDIIRELMTAILLHDGYKTYGEGGHKKLIEYLAANRRQFSEYEISLIDDLRVTRNKIANDGFSVDVDYLKRKIKDILKIIGKMRMILNKCLS